MKLKTIFLGIVGLALVGFGSASFYVVNEAEQAIVLQFGNPKNVSRDAGIYYKHFFQDVRKLDKRILNLDVRPEEFITADKKRLLVDSIVRFRITDPLSTYIRVQTEERAGSQLETIVKSSLRDEIGRVDLNGVVSGERASLMRRIASDASQQADGFGVTVVDVQIKRADLPAENSQAVYERMRTEREREAQEARSEGSKEADRIRAEADRDKTIILAEATRDSEILRGEGDSRAVKIFADAYSQDEEFFSFYRTMQAYRDALDKNDTTLILSPDSEFFEYFGSDSGRDRP